MEIYDLGDYLLYLLMIITVALLILVLVAFVLSLFKECIQYEDLCYYDQIICTKGCTIREKPINCSDSKVIGHKDFCIKYKWKWEHEQ